MSDTGRKASRRLSMACHCRRLGLLAHSVWQAQGCQAVPPLGEHSGIGWGRLCGTAVPVPSEGVARHLQTAHDGQPPTSGACLSDPQPLWFVPLQEDGLGSAREPWLLHEAWVLEEKSVTLLCGPFSILSQKFPVTVILLSKDMTKILGNYSEVIITNEKKCIYLCSAYYLSAFQT